VTVANLPPSVSVGSDLKIATGADWTPVMVPSVSDPSPVDRASLVCDWDFGDGRRARVLACDDAGARLTHAYASPGVYTATLTVTDKDGVPASDSLVVDVADAPAQLAGPGPYLSRADSPLVQICQGGPFYFEDFEDHRLDTPGVAGAPHGAGVSSVVFGPAIHDSVDGDDGSIDGSGLDGDTWFSPNGLVGTWFTFDPAVLGSLPTCAGLVWTDGQGQWLVFRAFGPDGRYLGQVGPSPLTDQRVTGETDEDRFFGVVAPGGISMLYVANHQGGIEVDHLQYGWQTSATVTPTATPSATGAATATASATATATPTPTATATPSASPTPTATATPSASPTVTPSPTVSPTPTRSSTATVSATPSATPTATDTPTVTPTPVGPPPSVGGLSLPDGAVLTTLTGVSGAVGSQTLASWRLEHRPEGDPTWTTFALGTTPVDGPLGVFDPTLLLNGLYEIRLTATDVSGRSASASVDVVVEGSQKVGTVGLSFLDVEIPVAGLPIQVVRTYDSRDQRVGDFGVGWTLDVRDVRLQESRALGSQWVGTVVEDVLFIDFCVEPARTHVVTVTLPDGTVHRFEPTLEPQCQAYAPPSGVTIGFRPLPGTTSELVPLGISDARVSGPFPGQLELVDLNTGLLSDPDLYQLTLADGRVLIVDQRDGLQRIVDLNGNTLDITRDGIFHSAGRSVFFRRDDQDRITRIDDPTAGTIGYAYDARGDLVAVTDQVGATTQFVYSGRVPHHLERIVDRHGVAITTFEFDDAGRMIARCDADANCTRVDHDLVGRRETIVDPTGRQATYTYDERGNVLSLTDGLGQTRSLEYNADGEVTKVVDATGAVTTYTYDARGHLLTQTDPHPSDRPAADFTTHYAYDARGALTSLTTPSGAQVRLAYDAGGNLLSMQDEAGNVLVAYARDDRGLPTEEQGPLGRTRYQYGPSLDLVSSTDGLDRTTTMTYDAAGRLTAMTGPDGQVSSFEYDALGRETVADYGQGISVSYRYDVGPLFTSLDSPTIGHMERRLTPNGRLAARLGPDGVEASYSYDRAGRLSTETDALGNRTAYDYDAAGRLERVTGPTGAQSRVAYDAADRVSSLTDALGHRTSYQYAPDGRLASTTDARDQTWTYSHTTTSSATRDPLGRTTTTRLSPHGLPLEVVHPDGTSIKATYLVTSPLLDAQDRPTSITDEGGRVRRFGYDGLGRLATVTDLAGATYALGYDQSRLASITGPTGERLEYTYDGLENRQSVRHPDGGVATYSYGSNNRPSTVRMPSGRTISHTYDHAGREVSRVSSDGWEARLGWNASGAPISLQDATGTTSYSYTAGGELAAIDSPRGGQVRYQRDLLGRVTAVHARAAAGAPEYVTRYAYDAVGNIVSIVDPLGGQTALVYDEVSRLTRRTLPNGVSSDYSYDDRDRVVSIVHRAPDGGVLASSRYERGPTGEPIRITREDGSRTELSYDGALRLSGESHHDASGALVEQIAYTYDAAGKRLTRSDGAGARTYSYAPGYRLTGSVGPSGPETYGYDADGRVTLIARDGVTRTLDFDADDRLAAVRDAGGAPLVSYRHDAAQRRVAAVDAAGARHFLVSPAIGDGLESTHLIVDDANALLAGYVYAGEHPLMRFGPDGPVYYLTDASGSVISLADALGAGVASFRYDGFGNLRTAAGPAQAAPSRAGGDFRFHGAWLESGTGLYHLRAREYDPRVGRFLSRDPVEVNDHEPESMNAYAFARSNPLVYRDPTGREDLVSLNINMSMEQIMSSVGRASMQYLRSMVRDEIKEMIGKAFASGLQAFLGAGGWGEVGKAAGLAGMAKAGQEFEDLLKDHLCSAFKADGLFSYLWMEPSVSATGDAVSDGFSCSQYKKAFKAGKKLLPIVPGKKRPDFIVKKTPPTDIAHNRKALLIGDLKLTGSKAYSDYVAGGNPGQFTAIAKYAFKRAAKVALIVTAWGPTQHQSKALRQKFAKEGVLVLIVSVRDP
jgi:RHS repeat-associated protein